VIDKQIHGSEFESTTQPFCEQGQPCLPGANRQAYFVFQTSVTSTTPHHLQPYFFFPTLFSFKNYSWK
jgi:hypothetical protein